MTYESIDLVISPTQQKKALKGGSIIIKKDCIGKGAKVFLHKENMKKLKKCKGGGVSISFSPGEIMKTASHHGLITLPDGLTGAGFFDDVWSGIKSVGTWLKDSGVGSTIADALVPVASSVIGPTGAVLARKILKGTTGVGLKKKATKTPKGKGLYL
jgi:hypothetical protein